LKMRKIWFD